MLRVCGSNMEGEEDEFVERERRRIRRKARKDWWKIRARLCNRDKHLVIDAIPEKREEIAVS